MLPIDNWIIILITAGLILAIYSVFYKITMSQRLHTLTEEHKVSEPHNDLVLLKRFVEQCWQRGYSIPEIKSVLLKKGWNENTINKALYSSKVPNAEEKVSRVQKAFTPKPKPQASTPIKSKESRFAAIKSRVQKPKIKKPQVQVKPLKSEEKIKTLKKVSKPLTNQQEDKALKIGPDSSTSDEDYTESSEVTKLKKEVLKGVKNGES